MMRFVKRLRVYINMNDILISIIIPIYNVEQYLAQCLDSIYNQDIDETKYEVICINDVSPDRSREIVLKFQTQHRNLVFIEHERNLRQGGARNSGLRVAKGKYIWFVDPDDYIEPNVLAYLINQMENYELDAIHFDYKRIVGDDITSYRTQYVDDNIYTGKSFLMNQNNELWWQRCIEVWRYIYNRNTLNVNDIRFVENQWYEDMEWSLHFLEIARRVKHIMMSPYYYRMNPSSTTQSEISFQKLKDKCTIIKYIEKVRNDSIFPNFDTEWNKYIQYALKDVNQQLKSMTQEEQKLLLDDIAEISTHTHTHTHTHTAKKFMLHLLCCRR